MKPTGWLERCWRGHIPRDVSLCLFCVALCLRVQPAAGATLYSLAANGASSNRLNVVFLSEGYTTAQLPKFLLDATNALDSLLGQEPFNEYRRYFNAFAIAVASNQSGSDHPNQTVDTYFNTSYDSVSDFIITMPTNSLGQGKIDALVRDLIPDADLKILLVNDPYPGGSDGFGLTAICSVAPGSSDFLSHEVGHVLAGLGDEYETPYPGFTDVEEPNTTRETRREFIKWKAWINPEIPVPTPATFDFMDVIGLFEGAHYHATGWYRPKFDCRMNHPAVPFFCEVCRESLILSIYKKVRPIDALAPATNSFTAASDQPISFDLDLLQPATHALEVQWLTNGVVVANSSMPRLTLPPGSLVPGTNLISATVQDPTDMVRTDPLRLVNQTQSWNVNLAPSANLRLETPLLDRLGTFVFHITGGPRAVVVVQRSTNLKDWASIATNSFTGGQSWFTNTSSLPTSFFRVAAP